jgi:heme exporter protein A
MSLTTSNLACRRGNRLLFKGFDLDLGAGDIVWLRGQNGCGKTSLLRLLVGLAIPDKGQVLWGGVPVGNAADFCDQVAFVGHNNALKEDLTVSEALEFLLQIHNHPHSEQVVLSALERFAMHSRRSAMVRTLSQGQRRRVALARLAVAEQAALWILDEPFDALDADGVARLNSLLSEHARQGGSVLLTSHQSVNANALRIREVDLDRYC